MWYKKTLVSVWCLFFVAVGYASEKKSVQKVPEVNHELVSVSTETLLQSSSTIQNNNSSTVSGMNNAIVTNNVPNTSKNNPVVLSVISEESIPVNNINSPEPETILNRLDQKVIDFCGPKINAGIQKIDELINVFPWYISWIKKPFSVESRFLDYSLAMIALCAYVGKSKNTNLYVVLFGIRYVYRENKRDKNNQDEEEEIEKTYIILSKREKQINMEIDILEKKVSNLQNIVENNRKKIEDFDVRLDRHEKFMCNVDQDYLFLAEKRIDALYDELDATGIMLETNLKKLVAENNE
jgi:hypothetical protein